MPYHKGYTCEEFDFYDKSHKCRYCEQPVCQDQDCRQKMQNACQKILQCGHQCFGFKEEEECPPCLECDNVSPKNLFNCRLRTNSAISAGRRVWARRRSSKANAATSSTTTVFRKTWIQNGSSPELLLGFACVQAAGPGSSFRNHSCRYSQTMPECYMIKYQ